MTAGGPQRTVDNVLFTADCTQARGTTVPKRDVKKERWEADERPEPRSLGLLPSGSDPVGEWLVHRQPPDPYIGRGPRESKHGRLAP
jgi:hypothetical protein